MLLQGRRWPGLEVHCLGWEYVNYYIYLISR